MLNYPSICELCACLQIIIVECWAHEESKGWRFVNVNAELPNDSVTNRTLNHNCNNLESDLPDNSNCDIPILQKDDINNENALNKEADLIDLNDGSKNCTASVNASSQSENKDDLGPKEKDIHEKYTQNSIIDEKSEAKIVQLVKTSCGDAHNIGLDIDGRAYSLPSPLDFDPFPSGYRHKVR